MFIIAKYIFHVQSKLRTKDKMCKRKLYFYTGECRNEQLKFDFPSTQEIY